MNPTGNEYRHMRKIRDKNKTVTLAKRRRDKFAVREIETKCFEDHLTSRKVEYLEQKRK